MNKKLSKEELKELHIKYIKYDLYEYGNKMCNYCGNLLDMLQKCDCKNNETET